MAALALPFYAALHRAWQIAAARGQRLGDLDAVRNVHELSRVKPPAHHVLVCMRQDGDHHLSVFVSPVLGTLKKADRRVIWRVAAEQDRRERPKIMHLEHELRLCLSCNPRPGG